MTFYYNIKIAWFCYNLIYIFKFYFNNYYFLIYTNIGKINNNERYHCPFLGCNIDCTNFMKLKAHYKASLDYKGSGQKKGHGLVLTFCPKCNKLVGEHEHHTLNHCEAILGIFIAFC